MSTVDRVFMLVHQYTGIGRRQLLGADRHAPIADARHIAAYVLRRTCRLSYPEIGRLLDRDHSTVIHGVRRVEKDERLKRRAEVLLGKVGDQ